MEKLQIAFGETSFTPTIRKIASKEFANRAFADMRKHVKAQRPGGLSLMALAIRGEPLTADEWLELNEDQGRRRLILKAQVVLCMQNQNA
jgi:hypothetical protein